MNKKIFENARFCPKGDTEANWNKAVGFVPLKKEIIEYLPDENNAVTRFKVGDGVTPVQDLLFVNENLATKEEVKRQIAAIPQADWNQHDSAAADYIKNRPFHDKVVDESTSKIYTFDGNIEGKDAVNVGDEEYPQYFVKISDDTPTKDLLIGATVIIFNPDYPNSQIEIILSEEEIWDDAEYGVVGWGLEIKENCYVELYSVCDAELAGFSFGNGLYFVHTHAQEAYISQLKIQTIIQPLKKIDMKFMPEEVTGLIYGLEDKVDKYGDSVIEGNLEITKNLTVKGTTITKNTETLLVKDNIIVANSEGSYIYSNDLSGFAIKTGSTNAYGIMYDQTGDGVKIGLGSIDTNGKFDYAENEAQFLATRDDHITGGNVAYWDNDTKKFVDSKIIANEVVVNQMVKKATAKDIQNIFNEEVVL